MTRGELTRDKILKTGIKMWLNNPDSVTANAIAEKIGVVHATVLYHFPKGVKDSVAEYAVQTGEKKIICQLIALDHKAVRKLSQQQKTEYLSQL